MRPSIAFLRPSGVSDCDRCTIDRTFANRFLARCSASRARTINLGLGSLLPSNVSGNLYSADDLPFRTLDRRDGQRNVDQAPVFASTNGLKIIDLVTAPHMLEYCVLLI